MTSTLRAGVLVRRQYVVRGVVQGVGFRPFVHATATGLGLIGEVHNDAGGVVVEVEGPRRAVMAFGARLVADAPPLALIEDVEVSDRPLLGGIGFRITRSARETDATRTLSGPDVATCADCLRELRDPADRRYRHPFATCTNCGPRFTITVDLPYDRATTTMAGFPMCSRCAGEYADPADRRFHAQPIACPDCGPRLEFLGSDDPDRPDRPDRGAVRGDEEALAAARLLLRDGGVLAVKGLGGYHLACRATDPDAVALLRRRKRRGAKPFAVMVADLAAARDLAVVDEPAERLLTGPARPIVLLPASGPVADAVAPGVGDLGLLLPYTPLHHLLLGDGPDGPGPGPLVMTSGNLGGEPIVFSDDDALRRLAPLADGWLRHDRPVHVPCDDSVARIVDGEELPIRRSRGYAPLPVPLAVEVPPTLGAGAELKNTLCLAAGRRAWLSGHVGDMDDAATLAAATAATDHLEHLTGVRPRTVAADAHPGYRSRAWAAGRAGEEGVRPVQHHHAHVAALLAEHGWRPDRPVVGIALDGTGYGSDGAVWGGEVLLADGAGFTRLAHLAYVPLAGGDASIQRPYRMALAHLAVAGVPWEPELPPVAACPVPERRVLAHQLTTGLGCVPTSSVGRLFDAVASLAGVRQTVDYEAQAAMELEFLARHADPGDRSYPFPVRLGQLSTADPGPLVRAVADDVRGGVPAPVVAARFHQALAAVVCVLARAACRQTGVQVVGLTGGVFQNTLLLSAVTAALRDDGLTVLRHRVVPPNDGGLSLGQVFVAAAGPLPTRGAAPANPEER